MLSEKGIDNCKILSDSEQNVHNFSYETQYNHSIKHLRDSCFNKIEDKNCTQAKAIPLYSKEGNLWKIPHMQDSKFPGDVEKGQPSSKLQH